MTKAILFIGAFLHKIHRAFAILAASYSGWLLRSHVTKNARKCGSIYFAGHGRITHVNQIEVGKNVHVNTGAYWVCEGGLTIGDNTIMSSDVTIYTRNHNYTGQELPFDETNVFRPVEIGRNVWIGTRVTILPGSKIGDGAIIGAGSVVAGEVPPCAIFGAPPAQQIKMRDIEHYKALESRGAYHQPRYALDVFFKKNKPHK